MNHKGLAKDHTVRLFSQPCC